MIIAPPPRAATGIDGLDDVLNGGLIPDRLYLLEGRPGTGKTTLGFQFLLDGVRQGESVMYVTLSETQEEIRAVAASHGWSLDGVAIRELISATGTLDGEDEYTVFHPSEVELGDTTRRMLEDVERAQPSRLVLDSLSELRLLAGTALRYRRQILGLKQFFAGRRCTVLMLDDLTSAPHDLQVQSIAHGAVMLELQIATFGAVRRRLSVTKYRGSEFRGGYHDYQIRRGGIEVYPRLVAAEHRQQSSRERLRSGIDALDALLGGGLERGSSTLIQGAAGTGKSTIAALFAAQAAERGEHSALFLFEESTNTLFERMEGFGIDLHRYVASGLVRIRQVDPAEVSPGELAHEVRQCVEADDARLVVFDSLNGFLNSMPDETALIVHLHELMSYLGQLGVATVLIGAHQGILGTAMNGPVDASYIADAVLLLRYFEADGEVNQAISVVKMRGGDHERTLREFTMKAGRISIGEPLRHFRGVLTGVPERQSPP
ncbi:MAG: ATPase domain-containing protein [Betaproteobacteria bacterium]